MVLDLVLHQSVAQHENQTTEPQIQRCQNSVISSRALSIMLKALLNRDSKKSSKERGRAARAKGHKFEVKVAGLLRNMGYRNVTLNNRMKDSNGHLSGIPPSPSTATVSAAATVSQWSPR